MADVLSDLSENPDIVDEISRMAEDPSVVAEMQRRGLSVEAVQSVGRFSKLLQMQSTGAEDIAAGKKYRSLSETEMFHVKGQDVPRHVTSGKESSTLMSPSLSSRLSLQSCEERRSQRELEFSRRERHVLQVELMMKQWITRQDVGLLSECLEERVAALEAVRKTAKEQVSGETQRTSEQTPEFAESLIEIARIRETLPRKNLDIRSPTVPNVFAGPTLLFRATTKLNGLQVCLGGLGVPRQLQSATGVGLLIAVTCGTFHGALSD